MVKLILNAGIAGDLHAKRDAIDALARQMVLDNAREIVDGIRACFK